MQVPVYNKEGETIRQTEIADSVFAVPFNEAVVHQAMVRQRNNARQGTASAKARAEVVGSSRKLFRQKGTGRARAGNSKSPLRRGGGVTFGPKPRDFSQDMSKKMRRLAIRCLLSSKATGEKMKVLDKLDMKEPKTKEMAEMLAVLDINVSALIARDATNSNIVKSARNLPKVKTTPAKLLNVGDLLSYGTLLLTEDAVRQIEALWGSEAAKGGENASV